ncbi:hypothetical protein HN51_007265 [Arachis hypogaea]|nr:uncharacterized protein LOC112801040 isoform X4 [Arachis hypogaea]
MTTMIAKGCSEGKASRVLYVSGEESLEKIGNRAERFRIKSDIYLYSSTDIEWSEQNVKLNDVEHKLKDQGRQLKVQQKRIGSSKKTIHLCIKS